MEQTGAYDLLRPFLWLFVVGFLLGFGGYLAIGGGQASASPERIQPQAISTASDDWNAVKAI